MVISSARRNGIKLPFTASQGQHADLWTLLTRNFGTRLLTLPITITSGLALIAVSTRELGAHRFGAVSIVWTMVLLIIPIADLGRGAVVANAFAGTDRPSAIAALSDSLRFMLKAGAVLAATSGLISLGGWWPMLLGPGGKTNHIGLAMTLTWWLIAIALPLGLGARVLLGLGLNHRVTLLAACGPLCALSIVLIAALFGSPFPLVAAAIPAGYVFQAGLQARAAMRLGRFSVAQLRRSRSDPSSRAHHLATARPMLLIMAGLPLAMQSDRLVLSHANPKSLPAYALVAQMYAPMYSLLATAGIALWPFFASARRVAGNARAVWLRATLALGLVGVLLGVVLFTVTRVFGDFLSGGSVRPSASLPLAFAGLLCMQGLQYVVGVYFTRPSELRLQAVSVWVMVPVNLAVSWVLARQIGGPGPVLATVFCLGTIQWLPFLFLIKRSHDVDRDQRDLTSTPTDLGASATARWQ